MRAFERMRLTPAQPEKERDAMSALDQFLQRMPKVELHLHLEGAVRTRTLLELARKNGVSLYADDVAGIESRFRYTSLQDFLDVFMNCARALSDGRDFERLAIEMGEDLAQQNVCYAEVMISPMQHLLRGLNFDEILAGLAAGYAQVERDYGVVLRTVFDYGRQFGVERAWRVLEIASAGRAYGVVGFSIGGDELNYPPELFREVFAAASAKGLRLMAHAGEVVGPPSIWGAVDVLGCERIGHGVRGISDPALLTHLRERNVVLDVCPTSNLCTGAVASLEEHPLRRLYEAGVRISINSDDPTFFVTTLTDEFRLAAGHFGFDIDEICELVQDGARATFLPIPAQEQLVVRLHNEQQALRAELGL